MTHTESEPFRLSRRRALQGAAWTAPVIVVASAAPAFAVSPGSSLDLQRGTSQVVVGTNGPDEFYDLQFAGLSVIVPTALAAGQLTLTVSYTPTSPGGPNGMIVLDTPSGWTISPTPGNTSSSVLLTYAGAVVGGTEVQVPNGIFIGGELTTAAQTGIYVVTATAPALDSDVESFATPVGPRPARGAKRYPRPVFK